MRPATDQKELGISVLDAEPKRAFSLERLFRTAMIVVPLGVLGNIVFTLYTTDRGTFSALGAFPRHYLALAVILGLVPWFTNAFRLVIWTRFIGYSLSVREALRIVLGSEVGSSLLPTSTGGELIRLGMLVQRGVPAGAAGSIFTLAYLEDTLFFAIALPAAFIWSGAGELPIFVQIAEQFQTDALRALLIGIMLLVGALLVLRMVFTGWLGRRVQGGAFRGYVRTRHRVRRTWSDARGVYVLVMRRGKLRFVATWLLGAIQWTCRYSVATALVAFLGAPVDPVLFFLLQWVVFTAMMFIPTPGASGGAEAAFYLVYSALIPAGIIGLATAGWRFFTFYLQLGLGSLVFALLNVEGSRRRSL
ncbi:flippase-like domain-containing protein [soil metagenome]